ncbi:MAG: hypothetical protein QXS92_04310, partial [Thermofilum sp.]
MARVALDTSVIVEYIDLKGRYHRQARAIFESVLVGKLEGFSGLGPWAFPTRAPLHRGPCHRSRGPAEGNPSPRRN